MVCPRLEHFVVVPIDLERRVKLSVPILVHFALLLPSRQVVLPGFPTHRVVAVARSLSLGCPRLAAVVVASGFERPKHSAVVVQEFGCPKRPVVAPGFERPNRS